MYQVWTKGDEYTGWARKDCPDLEVALAEVLAAIKAGKEPFLTQGVEYEVGINIKEGEPSETKKGNAKSDKVAGGESHSKVRRGDETVTPELDKGSGDSGAGPGAGD